MTDAATTSEKALDQTVDKTLDGAGTAVADAERRAAGKVVQLRARVQESADALKGWASDQAGAIATTAKEKPLAAAGVSAGAAFAAGLIFGLLIARASRPEPTWKDRLLELKPNW